MNPLISICLPSLNAARFLEERMASIVSQTLRDWELIVCDSHSDDGSWELFKRFEGDSRIRLHQVPRAGLYAGWNECLRRARGEYVYIAPADDTCEPSLLEKLTGALDRYPDVDLAACRYRRIDAQGRFLPDDLLMPELYRFLGEWVDRAHLRKRLPELLIMLGLDCQWNTLPAVVFRRSLLAKTGLFRTDTGSYADVIWRIKAILHSDLLYVPETLVAWRWHDAQATARLGPADRNRLVYFCQRETLRECRALVPDEWRSDPRWMDRMLCRLRHRYLMHYHLNRTALRKTPASFFAGMARASIREPAYLFRRFAAGFSWAAPEYGDPVEQLRALMREWRVEWPPRKD